MRTLASLAALLALTACQAPQQRLDAAEDIRAFLVAARENDRATFDRHVDRPALKAQLRAEMAGGLAEQLGLPAQAAGPVLDQIVDSFGPETFRLATPGAGPLANRTPTAPEIAAALRPLEDGRVCLPRSPGEENCAVTFGQSGDVWKVVAVDVSGMTRSAAPEMLDRFPR